MTNQSPPLWQIFSAAPHRMMFFGGAFQLIATLTFWLIELAGRTTELWQPLVLVIPATYAHINLMLYGIFPLFTLGFLLTTYPKWMGGSVVTKPFYIPSFFLQIAGSLLFYLGLFTSVEILVVAVLLHISGWFLGYIALIKVFKEAKGADRYHTSNLNASLAFGMLGEAFFFFFLVTGMDYFLQLSLSFGLWLYLVSLLFIVCHRMLPFFASCVLKPYVMIRPGWSLHVMWICLAGHLFFEVIGIKEWLFVFDIPLACWGLYHTFLWGFIRSLKIKLLSVIFISLLWFSIAMLLYSAQSLTLFLTDSFILGKAPIHAIGIGFITSAVIAMGTRVSLGHSGRPLVMDNFSWICFFGVQAAAILRVAGEIQFLDSLTSGRLNLFAAICWLIFLIPWGLRYGIIFLRPRVDGLAG